MSSATVKAPPNTVVVLGGTPYQLRWDKGAMFRADEIGLFEKRKPGIGIAAGAKYIWAMGPASLRETYATPEAVAEAFPDGGLRELWEAINNAVAAAKETTPKNGNGSTSGLSPASS